MAGRQVPQTGTVIGVSWATIRRLIQMPIALPNLNSSLGRFGWPSAENFKWAGRLCRRPPFPSWASKKTQRLKLLPLEREGARTDGETKARAARFLV